MLCFVLQLGGAVLSISAVVSEQMDTLGIGHSGLFVCTLLFKTLLALIFNSLKGEN